MRASNSRRAAFGVGPVSSPKLAPLSASNLAIVSARKQGQHVFYTLTDQHIHDLYCQGLAHIEHE